MIPNTYQRITIIIMCNLCDILQLDTVVSHNRHTTKHQNCCAGVTFVLRSCNLFMWWSILLLPAGQNCVLRIWYITQPILTILNSALVYITFEDLMAVSIKTAFFCDVLSCSVIDRYYSYRETCWLCFQCGRKMKEANFF